MEIALIVIGIIVLSYVVAVAAGGAYVYNLIISRKGVAKERAAADAKGLISPFRSHTPECVEWWNKQSFTRHEADATDGVKLVAYSMPAKKKTNRTALVCHGHDCNCVQIGFIVRMFYEAGYNVFVPVMRANFESGGEYYSFGVLESDDVLMWLKKIPSVFGDDCSVVAYGNSLGGASVCMLSAKDNLPKELKCVISDCAFSSLKGVIEFSMPKLPKSYTTPVIWTCNLYCRIFGGFSFLKSRPIDSIKRAKVPVFFVHGTADPTTKWEMSRDMYELCPTEKELLLFPVCPHGVAYFADTKKYEKSVFTFIERYI